MVSTVLNVAAGSTLKVIGYVLGRAVDGYFENKRLNLLALSQKTEHLVKVQGGNDTADDHTKHTRRWIALIFATSTTTVLVLAALNTNWAETVSVATQREGLWGWLVGGTTKETTSISARILIATWTLLEVMFGFYFTKIGK